MNKENETLNARDFTSEEQLKGLLERCGFQSDSPKDIDWLSHWWEKEFEPNLPPFARHIVVFGDKDFALDLCLTIENDKFVIYMFNHQDYWFNRLGIRDEFSSVDELKTYLTQLVNQSLVNWEKWLKENRR